MIVSMPSIARSAAPGKVILLGEHAVVYGRAALAATIDRYVEVTVTPRSAALPSTPPRLHEALGRAAELTGIEPFGLNASVRADLPVSVGLGSSAALSVALIRALAKCAGQSLADDVVCTRAFEIEKIFHGFPSGIDNTVVTYGGLIAFRRDVSVTRLSTPRPLPLVIAIGRVPRETQTAVRALRDKWSADCATYEPVFDQIDALVAQAEDAIAAGVLPVLGALMNANHRLLQRLGISTDELDAMVGLARNAGALGAKLTGGGGGGAVICLCDNDRDRLVQQFTHAGWRAFAADIAERGSDGAADARGFEQRNSASA